MGNQIIPLIEQINNIEFQPEEISVEYHGDFSALTIGADYDSVLIYSQEKFGDGSTPYADDPTHHIEMLNKDDVAKTEGQVVYENGPTNDEYPLKLPKQIYFSKRIQFNSTPETENELLTELEAVLHGNLKRNDFM